MSYQPLAALLKTTSLVAGILALPACAPTANQYHQGAAGFSAPAYAQIEQHAAAYAAAPSAKPAKDGFTIVTEDDFSVEMVALDATPILATDTDNAAAPDASSGQAYRHETAANHSFSFAYGESFGPEFTAATQLSAPMLYEKAFGPDDARQPASFAAPMMRHETARHEPVRYTAEFGPRQPQAQSASAAAAPSSSGGEEGDVFAGSISDSELSTYRGAFAQETTFSAESADQINSNILTGTSAHNSATNVVTGNNSITPGAINFNGVGSFILNSGNNAVVQNSTIINLNMVTSGQGQ